jgi:hypothetical protein
MFSKLGGALNVLKQWFARWGYNAVLLAISSFLALVSVVLLTCMDDFMRSHARIEAIATNVAASCVVGVFVTGALYFAGCFLRDKRCCIVSLTFSPNTTNRNPHLRELFFQLADVEQKQRAAMAEYGIRGAFQSIGIGEVGTVPCDMVASALMSTPHANLVVAPSRQLVLYLRDTLDVPLKVGIAPWERVRKFRASRTLGLLVTYDPNWGEVVAKCGKMVRAFLNPEIDLTAIINWLRAKSGGAPVHYWTPRSQDPETFEIAQYVARTFRNLEQLRSPKEMSGPYLVCTVSPFGYCDRINAGVPAEFFEAATEARWRGPRSPGFYVPPTWVRGWCAADAVSTPFLAMWQRKYPEMVLGTALPRVLAEGLIEGKRPGNAPFDIISEYVSWAYNVGTSVATRVSREGGVAYEKCAEELRSYVDSVVAEVAARRVKDGPFPLMSGLLADGNSFYESVMVAFQPDETNPPQLRFDWAS